MTTPPADKIDDEKEPIVVELERLAAEWYAKADRLLDAGDTAQGRYCEGLGDGLDRAAAAIRRSARDHDARNWADCHCGRAISGRPA